MCELRNKSRGCDGFAVGMIFLVIILIAAVIGGIAAATRIGSSNGGDDQAAIRAASIMQVIENMYRKVEYDILSQGSDWQSFYIANLSNAVAQEAYFKSGNDVTPHALKDGALSRAAIGGSPIFSWYGTPFGVDYYATVYGVTDAVCRQFNKLLLGLDTSAVQPDIGTFIGGAYADTRCMCMQSGADRLVFCMLQEF